MLNVLRNHGKKIVSGLVLSGILGIGGVAAAEEQPAPSCCSTASCCGQDHACCGQAGSSCCPGQPGQGQAGKAS